MGLATSVGAVLAMAVRTTGQARVETLAVFLLTLALLAVAPLTLLFRSRFIQQTLPSLLPALTMFMVVATSLATAVLTTGPALSEALAVHLEALSFFTCAPSSFFLDGSGCGDFYFFLEVICDGELIFFLEGERHVINADSGSVR